MFKEDKKINIDNNASQNLLVNILESIYTVTHGQ